MWDEILRLLMLSALWADPAAAVPLKAGWAEVDITPPVGLRMAGYFSERLSTGIHDPLKAKALVFQQGSASWAIVVCDLIAIPQSLSEPVRQAAAARTGIPSAHIAVVATHTHTGPLFYGLLREHWHRRALAEKREDPADAKAYTPLLKEKLVEVISEAAQRERPVVLRRARRAQDPVLSFNRRYHMRDGSVRFNPGLLNPDIVKPAGPIDPDVDVLACYEHGSKVPGLVWTTFALHLDTVGGQNYSADFPYYLEKALREHFGPELISVFTPGPCGDINHLDVRTKVVRTTAEIGHLLSQTVLKALAESKVQSATLAASSETLRLPTQSITAEDVAWAEEILAKEQGVPFLDRVRAVKILTLRGRNATELALEVQAVRLSRETAVVCLPGEVFVELGLQIKSRSPFEQTLLVELANEAPGYIPTLKAFDEGSYEVVNSQLAPGGGEALAAAAERLLKNLSLSEESQSAR